MGSFSIWHWLIVLAVILLLFGGGGKIPRLMKDLGAGISNFRKGLKDTDDKDTHEDDAPTAKLEASKEESLDRPKAGPKAKAKAKAAPKAKQGGRSAKD